MDEPLLVVETKALFCNWLVWTTAEECRLHVGDETRKQNQDVHDHWSVMPATEQEGVDARQPTSDDRLVFLVSCLSKRLEAFL